MNRTIAIGLGAAVVGVVGTILIDRLAHGASVTVPSAVFLVVLIAAVLLLHRAALGVERAAGLSPLDQKQPPRSSSDSTPRNS